MAIYDTQERKIVVRVVYDGPGLAGKTTNIEQIAEIFTPRRRSILHRSYQQDTHRTLYLDWLQLDSGLVQGHELRCHLITVPGQAVLFRRRRALVKKADTIVFVVESTKKGIAEAKPVWESLFQIFEADDLPQPPVVVQANKQDTPGASSTDEVRVGLQVPSTISVVAAEALGGIGVRETLVLAMRAAANDVQKRILVGGLASLEGEYETGEELEAQIRADEQARPASPLEAAWERTDLQRVKSSPIQPIPADEKTKLNGSEDVEAPTTADSVFVSPANGSPEVAPKIEEVPVAVELHPSTEVTEEERSNPVFPDPNVVAGLVWPAATGRETLRRVPWAEARLRSDLAGKRGVHDGSGRDDCLIYEAGLWCLKTSRRRCFKNLDAARSQLLVLARQKSQLGDFLLPQTAIVVRVTETGRAWLWTVAPWVETLRSQLSYAVKTSNPDLVGEALVSFGEATVRALRLTLRNEVVLDAHPSNFGVIGKRCFYLDDDVRLRADAPSAGYALLKRVDEYHEHGRGIRRYVDRLKELLAELQQEEVEKLGLQAALQETIVMTPDAKAARAELLRSLEEREFRPEAAR